MLGVDRREAHGNPLSKCESVRVSFMFASIVCVCVCMNAFECRHALLYTFTFDIQFLVYISLNCVYIFSLDVSSEKLDNYSHITGVSKVQAVMMHIC